MECPRCGARLARISLGDRRSVYCEECRFADIESDHTRVSDGEETWDDALRRFRTAHAGETEDRGGDDTDVTSDDAPVETVHGIGPAYADRLETVGVTTLAELTEVDATSVADRLDVPESTVTDWVDQARRIAPATAADTDPEANDGRDADAETNDGTNTDSADNDADREANDGTDP
jgi:predicted flap endonuclease-1-like 5' DNA nuclease